MTTRGAVRPVDAASREDAPSAHRLCVAPMMAWTDRHCRFLHRLAAPSARLYTEMLSTDALLHGDAERLLAFDRAEHPVAAQIGGSDPAHLAKAARLVERAGFDEVNLNVGCPSARVQRGGIGACLMREPRRVADGIAAMRAAVTIPVTVKCRIGVTDTAAGERSAWEREGHAARENAARNDFGALRDFVGEVAQAGVRVFIVHARKAVLKGLTPAQNRCVPELRPELVERLARELPHLAVIVNGGIRESEAAHGYLHWAAGIMVGRKAYQDPVWLSRLDADLCGTTPKTAEQVFGAYLPYVARRLGEGVPLRDMTRHMLTLFNGRPGARAYRRHLSAHQRNPHANVHSLLAAAGFVCQSTPAASAA
ncbi:MAG: tRNA dihydrouridine(20/20a) synthase DusA [Gammaproteobacteria bacterium]|nr:tRNA dihydrouridine(20/20a) synthase DusA [Gammaproteobacteria bacterium]